MPLTSGVLKSESYMRAWLMVALTLGGSYSVCEERRFVISLQVDVPKVLVR
jgi:hypothetical protein